MTVRPEMVRRLTRSVEWAGSAIALGAMLIVLVRAALRLELRWDTFSYHLPFAARRGGLGVPYDFLRYIEGCYQGFPPLPEFVQGVLWRVTGSIHATGIVNWLALALFLFFTWRCLQARVWVVALMCLTAPLVLIHAASSYVDLFSNALLAIGVSAFLAMALFDRRADRELLLWGLAGLAGAAWSKFSTLPVVLVLFVLLIGIYLRRRELLKWVLLAFLLALIPYLKNIALYRNPTWPGGIPALKGVVPALRETSILRDLETPPPLIGRSQSVIFFHSLFEIGHPVSYPDRERWNIDQGNAWLAFRSGGFWVVAVVTGTLAAILLGVLSGWRRGLQLAVMFPALWGLICFLPQSHELRYFQFLPLTLAAMVAMLLSRVRTEWPVTTLVVMSLILGEFVWIAKVNRSYFRVERIGYQEAAAFWGVTGIWKTLERGKTYCAVGFEPAGFLLTGPTMHEFRIIDRAEASECPGGMPVLHR